MTFVDGANIAEMPQ